MGFLRNAIHFTYLKTLFWEWIHRLHQNAKHSTNKTKPNGEESVTEERAQVHSEGPGEALLLLPRSQVSQWPLRASISSSVSTRRAVGMWSCVKHRESNYRWCCVPGKMPVSKLCRSIWLLQGNWPTKWFAVKTQVKQVILQLYNPNPMSWINKKNIKLYLRCKCASSKIYSHHFIFTMEYNPLISYAVLFKYILYILAITDLFRG